MQQCATDHQNVQCCPFRRNGERKQVNRCRGAAPTRSESKGGANNKKPGAWELGRVLAGHEKQKKGATHACRKRQGLSCVCVGV